MQRCQCQARGTPAQCHAVGRHQMLRDGVMLEGSRNGELAKFTKQRAERQHVMAAVIQLHRQSPLLLDMSPILLAGCTTDV